ncbi:hypothetical protein [Ekhidna sp.]
MEDWKDKMMNSLEGMKRVEPQEAVFQKIRRKIRMESLNKRQWLAVAATVTLVLSANLYFIITYRSSLSDVEKQDAYSTIVSDYNIY